MRATSEMSADGTKMTTSRNRPIRHADRIGAIGYGLDVDQQRAIVALWDWQEQSLRSTIVLGGPLGKENDAAGSRRSHAEART